MVSEDTKRGSIRGEVEYRKKLVRQQILSQERHFNDHKTSLDDVYETWMKPQIQKLDDLMKDVYALKRPSFFLEVGSENTHLGLHLRNKFGIDGVCIDLSFDTLKLGVPKVAEKLGVDKKPLLLVADVHHLPFRQGSFDLICCFGSLHHFYDLGGAIKEIRRVCIDKGVFTTSYDPLKPFLRSTAKESCSEVSYGILENSYTLWEYVTPLKKNFSKVTVKYSPSSEKLDVLYKIQRLKGSRIASAVQNIMPKKVALTLRLLWFGIDDFTSISVA